MQSRDQPKQTDPTAAWSHAKGVFWALVILAGFVGVLFFFYQAKRHPSSSEYEGKIVDKWAGYSHSELGSVPYFKLLVENAGGQRSTVAIDSETYYRVKVGMRIRKTSKGIELSSLTAWPPDVRKDNTQLRAGPNSTGKAVTEGHSHLLTSDGAALYRVDLTL
jgi:hypothetical protein